MEVSLQNAVIAAQRYHKNTSDASVLSQLENRLDVSYYFLKLFLLEILDIFLGNFQILNHSLQEWIVSTTFNNSPIRENLILVECLNYFSTFLCSVGCSSSLLTKIADFFYTFGLLLKIFSLYLLKISKKFDFLKFGITFLRENIAKTICSQAFHCLYVQFKLQINFQTPISLFE